MAKKQEISRDGPLRPVTPGSADEFAASLKRRGQAAKGLEGDLLTQVPLLYGSPGNLEPHGDPGIALARIHQEELRRRNGGGVFPSSSKPSNAALPFERTVGALALLALLFAFFGG